uniref:Ribosomal protein L10 n=1 Tax=Storeatula sp. CCMP1868 TaxID=195070 RepID=A0A2P1G860_9CRYP|nr:hypothetical protein StoMt_p018 [Storeatula sp. CCMP1868]AVM81147.1 hypothetical protein StoMt_p018 [Storeatula sp. CCMP1868]
MKLIQTKFKKIFECKNVVSLVQIQKLNNKKLLSIKKKLSKKDIKLKFTSSKYIKIMLSNLISINFYLLLQGEIFILYSNHKNWGALYKDCELIFDNFYVFTVFVSGRFFSPLNFKDEKVYLLQFLKNKSWIKLFNILSFVNDTAINLIQIKFRKLFNIISKLSNEK